MKSFKAFLEDVDIDGFENITINENFEPLGSRNFAHSFKVGEHQVHVNYMHRDDGDGKKKYAVHFNVDGHHHQDEKTFDHHTGQHIMSHVAASVSKFRSLHDPHVLKFGANEPKKANLYHAFAKRLAAKSPGAVVHRDHGYPHMGDHGGAEIHYDR